MAKLPFFKFDAESWLTGKVQVLNVGQIGIYANLMARVWRDGGSVENSRFLPRMLGCTEEQWQEALTDFLELGIVYEDDAKCLKIKFLDEQITAHGEFIAKCSEAGRSKGRRKVEAGYPEGTLKVPSTSDEGTPKHKKEERRKEKEDIREEIEREETGAYAPDARPHDNAPSCVAVPYPTKPSEVVDVATSQGRPMTEKQAQEFIDYYSATGWMMRGTRITDWRHKVGNWCDRQREIDARQKAQPTAFRQSPILTERQDYGPTQRGYGGLRK